MKKTATLLLQSLVSLLPVLYLALSWDHLPELVPVHFDLHFKPDDFGTKYSLLWLLLFISALSTGVSALVLNTDRLDPKHRSESSGILFRKISWTIVIFLALLSAGIVYATQHYLEITETGAGKYLISLIALLFAALGNFMNNIKPNYFIGLRTPWTLDDPDNWRMTHHVTARLWFFGGLLLFLLILFIPPAYAVQLLLLSLVPLVVIPVVYSYRLFKKKKNGAF